MRIACALLGLIGVCTLSCSGHGSAGTGGRAGVGGRAGTGASDPTVVQEPPTDFGSDVFAIDRARYQPIFDVVDRAELVRHLQGTAGERFTAAGKARFRD